MATRYFYVVNPTAADLAASTKGSDSPYVKGQSSENIYFLTTTDDDYVFSNGEQVYRQDEIDAFKGGDRVITSKRPDPFLLRELKRRGEGLFLELLAGNLTITTAEIAELYKLLAGAILALRDGHLAAARKIINDQSTTTEFTAALKTEFLTKVDAILDDYDWLKD